MKMITRILTIAVIAAGFTFASAPRAEAYRGFRRVAPVRRVVARTVLPPYPVARTAVAAPVRVAAPVARAAVAAPARIAASVVAPVVRPAVRPVVVGRPVVIGPSYRYGAPAFGYGGFGGYGGVSVNVGF